MWSKLVPIGARHHDSFTSRSFDHSRAWLAHWAADLCLTILGALLMFALFHQGGVFASDWNVVSTGVGLVGFLYWILPTGHRPSSSRPTGLNLALMMLVAYVALQILPLPLGILRVLSPSRAEIAQSIDVALTDLSMHTLSIAPSATILSLLHVLVYIIVFRLLLDITSTCHERRWRVVVPIIVIGAVEATAGLLGLVNQGEGGISGTYVNRNHFAGLLEMVFPFAAVYPFLILTRSRRASSSSIMVNLKAFSIWLIAAVLLVAIIQSFSRMGFVAVVSSFVIVAIGLYISVCRSSFRPIVIVLIICVAGGTAILLPPEQLITRFAELSTGDQLESDDRIRLWTESWQVIHAYPLFGCGLGGFESAFLKYKITLLDKNDPYAHNDYLQILAELGIIGSLILLYVILMTLYTAGRALGWGLSPCSRYLGVACLGGMVAIGIHSFVDFNLHIPANALVAAWISGVAVGSTHGNGRGLQTASRASCRQGGRH